MALNTHIAQTAVDFQGLSELKRSANNDPNDRETLNQVASQFEAIFVGMMLKSMRDASLADGLFDSSQSDTYRDMTDKQLAMDLSAKGGLGLKEVIVRQLGGANFENTQDEATNKVLGSMDSVPVRPRLQALDNPVLLQQVMQAAPSSDLRSSNKSDDSSFDSPTSFVNKLWPMAKQAADRLGVTPDVILAQAALETGWGKHVINKVDGESSYNLFNIKKEDYKWQK